MNAKRLRTIICVTAIATMLFSSMGIGAFATVEQGAPKGEVKAQGEEASTDTEEPAEETPQAEETPAVVEEEPAPTEEAAEPEVQAKAETDVINITGVTSIRTVSGHQRIKVVWSPATATITKEVEPTPDEPEQGEGSGTGEGTGTSGETGDDSGSGADPSTEPTTVTEPYPISQYIVQRASKGGAFFEYCRINLNENGTVKDLTGDAVSGSFETSPYWTKEAATAGGSSSSEYYFEDKDVGDGLMDNATKQFRGGEWSYRIIPVAGTVTGSASPSTALDSCVRTSYVKLKIKVNKKLTSHDKQHVKRSFKKGTTIYTCAFGYGRYQFIYNGNMYWLNRVGTKSHKSGYDKGHPYSAEEATYYVNTSPYGGSSTSKLIWVNTYTQRIYVFTGSAGNWSPLNGGGWYVSTGKAATPTIRYMDPKSRVLDSGRIVGKFKTINKKVKSRHGIPCWNCFSTWNAIHGQKKSWSIKGVPKSNGCVRNTNAHAKYIYNTCPKKTRVLIF